MSVDGKIPRTSGHFFEADDYPVTERTIFLAESVEQRVHRAGGGNFAQRWGNVEPYITRDVGIQKHFAQGCNCNITVFDRSEEHTSELQSLRHLVCRLLLEKKK